MKKRAALVGILGAASLMLAPIAPAHAGGAGALVFVGKAHLNATLCYPTLCGSPTTYTFFASAKKPDPHGGPSDCVGVEVSTKKAQTVWGPKCDINAGGNVNPGLTGGPHCGDSTGTSAGTISFHDGTQTTPKNTVGFAGGWPVSIGGTLPIIGIASKGSQVGPAVVIVNAAPDTVFKGDSCTTGADDFRVVGVGAAVTL